MSAIAFNSDGREPGTIAVPETFKARTIVPDLFRIGQGTGFWPGQLRVLAGLAACLAIGEIAIMLCYFHLASFLRGKVRMGTVAKGSCGKPWKRRSASQSCLTNRWRPRSTPSSLLFPQALR